MKYLLLLFSITSYLSEVFSQELLCNVRVNSSQIQTSDRRYSKQCRQKYMSLLIIEFGPLQIFKTKSVLSVLLLLM